MNALRNVAGWLRPALTLAGLLLALAPAARAQTQEQIGINVPFLVKDINTSASTRMSSTPREFTTIGATAYFVASDPVYGAELWKSDGTAAGTVMVKDIFPGAMSSTPANLVNMGGTLYFSANDGIHGQELWKSNGTAAGTMMVRNIWPGNGSSGCGLYTWFNGKTYFIANDGVNGAELWRTDGSEAGTVLVKDINPGAYGAGIEELAILNGKLYCLAYSYAPNATYHQLWRSDGTAAGTTVVTGLANLYNAGALTSVNGALYFTAEDTDGSVLMKSNGTAAGTVKVKSFGRGRISISPNPNSLVGLSGKLYFLSWHLSDSTPSTMELWQSDGTSAGTRLVKSILTTLDLQRSLFENLWSINGTLYFGAWQAATGTELWRSDGTAAGTRLLKDLYPGSGSSNPTALMNVRGKAWFLANDGTHGPQFWQSDGTAAGTRPVTSIPLPGVYNDYYTPGQPKVAPVTTNGTFFFAANDNQRGTELWKTTGTPAGATLVKDISINSDSSPNMLTAAGANLFFSANDLIHGQELWKSNVSAASTVMVKDIYPGSLGSGMSSSTKRCAVGSELYFAASEAAGNVGLWKSNGTPAGARKLKDGFANITEITSGAGGKIYFIATDAGSNTMLWQVNAVGSVSLVKDFLGTGNYYPSGYSNTMINVNGTLYFIIYSNQDGQYGLWKSNGTAGGTVSLAQQLNISSGLAAAGGKVFFVTRDIAKGPALWKSDGTVAGTVLVKGISEISQMTALGNTLYFSANDGISGPELWKSNGTAAGTVLVKDIWRGPGRAYPKNLTAVGNKLYFTADDGIHGPELWRTDGTAAGTVWMRDINPGPYGSNPTSLVNVYGTLYFNAYSPAYGNELWKSDGTPSGTWILSDAITPGTKGSNPANLTLVGSFLYFTAADYRTLQGRELWAIRVR